MASEALTRAAFADADAAKRGMITLIEARGIISRLIPGVAEADVTVSTLPLPALNSVVEPQLSGLPGNLDGI
jgi:hypothetical protein